MRGESHFARNRAKHGGLTYLLSTILSLILTSVLLPSPGKSARSVIPAANERKSPRIKKQAADVKNSASRVNRDRRRNSPEAEYSPKEENTGENFVRYLSPENRRDSREE